MLQTTVDVTFSRSNGGCHLFTFLGPALRPDGGGLPHCVGGSASASTFPRPSRRSLRYGLHARGAAYTALSFESFSRLVARAAVSTATGCNDSFPGGTCTRRT